MKRRETASCDCISQWSPSGPSIKFLRKHVFLRALSAEIARSQQRVSWISKQHFFEAGIAILSSLL
jgi:hypothetical protein